MSLDLQCQKQQEPNHKPENYANLTERMDLNQGEALGW